MYIFRFLFTSLVLAYWRQRRLCANQRRRPVAKTVAGGPSFYTRIIYIVINYNIDNMFVCLLCIHRWPIMINSTL